MDFGEKLQQLRKRRGLTQEELAGALFVSRTAVSKWESGRGYPGIDSLRAIAEFFSVSIDELLSGGELMAVAESEGKERTERTLDLVFGLQSGQRDISGASGGTDRCYGLYKGRILCAYLHDRTMGNRHAGRPRPTGTALDPLQEAGVRGAERAGRSAVYRQSGALRCGAGVRGAAGKGRIADKTAVTPFVSQG